MNPIHSSRSCHGSQLLPMLESLEVRRHFDIGTAGMQDGGILAVTGTGNGDSIVLEA
jgi:hypothetical protein